MSEVGLAVAPGPAAAAAAAFNVPFVSVHLKLVPHLSSSHYTTAPVS